MPKKNTVEFIKQYPEGKQVWVLASRPKGAWRIGVVKSQHNTNSEYNASIEVIQPGTPRVSKEIYTGWSNEVMPREVIAQVPLGTIYLIDTGIGSALGKRLVSHWGVPFEVYECSTRMQTLGECLGYVIIPGTMEDAAINYKKPGFKVWLAPPIPGALLSFLGEHLAEILDVYYQLNPEDKPSVKSNSEIQEVE